MTATAATPRIFTVCRADNRELIMRIEAENDYDARMTVSRMTGWSAASLTTQAKPSGWDD